MSITDKKIRRNPTVKGTVKHGPFRIWNVFFLSRFGRLPDGCGKSGNAERFAGMYPGFARGGHHGRFQTAGGLQGNVADLQAANGMVVVQRYFFVRVFGIDGVLFEGMFHDEIGQARGFVFFHVVAVMRRQARKTGRHVEYFGRQ